MRDLAATRRADRDLPQGQLLDLLRSVENETSLFGTSSHLLTVGRRPDDRPSALAVGVNP